MVQKEKMHSLSDGARRNAVLPSHPPPPPVKRRLVCSLNSTLLTENCTFITQDFSPNV